MIVNDEKNDKRRNVRVALGEGGRYSMPGETVPSKVLDISYRGMQLATRIPFVSGKEALLAVRLPNADKTLQIPCRFLHGKKQDSQSSVGEIAVEFVFQNSEQKQTVEDFVRLMKERSILANYEIEEHRDFPRINCLIVPRKKRKSRADFKQIVNISQNGLFLHFKGRLPPDAKISLTFNLPHDLRSIELQGEVIHREENPDEQNPDLKGLGLRFSKITPLDRKRIENHVLQQVSSLSLKRFYSNITKLKENSGFAFTDENKIGAILSEAQKEKVDIQILFGRSLRPGHSVIVELSPDHFSIDWSPEEEDSDFGPDDPVYFSFNYGRGSFYFQSVIESVRGTKIIFKRPQVINHSEKRSVDRAILTIPEPIMIEIGPSGPAGRALIKGEIVDVSPTGFSFLARETSSTKGLLIPGVGIHQVRQIHSTRHPLQAEGEIKHVFRLAGAGNKGRIKIGIEMGIKRNPCPVQIINRPEWDNESFFKDVNVREVKETEPFNEKSRLKKLIRYKNSDHHEIAAYLEATQFKKKMPVVILPPAFGKKKETLSPLVLTILANFRALGKDVALIRYDGTNRPGESYRSERFRRQGWEMLDYTVTQGTKDLEATLAYSRDNPHFEAEKIIIVSFSLASLKTRKLLSHPSGSGVDYWLNIMGGVDGQSAFRNLTGGLDIIGNNKMGLMNGIFALLGHLVDMDKLAKDMIEHDYAYLSDVRREMASISVPVTWIYGKYDSWINHADIHDVMNVESLGRRELIEIPAGHNLRSSKDAFKTFRIITRKLVEFLTGETIIPVGPPEAYLVRVITEERERIVRNEEIDLNSYWRAYLLGPDENSYGYDFLKNLREFREFLALEEKLLSVEAGQRLADLGCGTGLFMESFLNNLPPGRLGLTPLPTILMADFIDEALAKCRLKYENFKAKGLRPLPEITFRNINLEANRLLPVKRYLDGQYKSFAELRGRIEGLTLKMIDKILRAAGPHLETVLHGRPLSPKDRAVLKAHFSADEIEVLADFGRAARFVQKKLIASDFQKFECARARSGAGLTTDDLRFSKLRFRNAGLHMKLPFPDRTFDRVLTSLLISYLLNPDECLKEFYRIIKPGGRLVVSTMKPDADMSLIFTRYVSQVQNDRLEDVEITDKDDNLRGARSMLNEAATLFELEEDGYFKFFSQDELARLLEQAGFTNIQIVPSLGDPPQAHIAVGIKSSGSNIRLRPKKTIKMESIPGAVS
jgi:ubiquinone/menaquinone biosynthesis C-methylase UbiE